MTNKIKESFETLNSAWKMCLSLTLIILGENNPFTTAFTELPKIYRILVMIKQLNRAEIPDSY